MKNKVFIFCTILAIITFAFNVSYAQTLLKTNNGQISFTSQAPLELIKAKSENCQGILNADSGEFAFRVFLKSFDGFNNPLQKEHFYENYLEVSDFPEATFTGNLIENLVQITSVQVTLRAKGILTIHGVSKERIIEVSLKREEEGISFNSLLDVPLEDHDIEIPAIVRQKIAEKIEVSVSGILK